VLQAAHPELRLGPPNGKGWQDIPLGNGVSLSAMMEAQENWLWVGLKFDGKKAASHYDAVVASVDRLERDPAFTAVAEDTDTDRKWLGSYRLVRLKDRPAWGQYVDWARRGLNRYRQLHAAATAPASVVGGTATAV
jgi:hypothetical protein